MRNTVQKKIRFTFGEQEVEFRRLVETVEAFMAECQKALYARSEFKSLSTTGKIFFYPTDTRRGHLEWSSGEAIDGMSPPNGFRKGNGVTSVTEMRRQRIGKYRRAVIGQGDNPNIGCVKLGEPFSGQRPSGYPRLRIQVSAGSRRLQLPAPVLPFLMPALALCCEEPACVPDRL